ncbi:MAG TPA: hypothetical protein VFW60_02170 [Rhodanobacteraceae bacterium]|nr:hypothetical protein [Rhodanobacteraceae bacterium]
MAGAPAGPGRQATPTTCVVDGKQYVVVLAGGHGSAHMPLGDSVIACTLPKNGGGGN